MLKSQQIQFSHQKKSIYNSQYIFNISTNDRKCRITLKEVNTNKIQTAHLKIACAWAVTVNINSLQQQQKFYRHAIIFFHGSTTVIPNDSKAKLSLGFHGQGAACS